MWTLKGKNGNGRLEEKNSQINVKTVGNCAYFNGVKTSESVFMGAERYETCRGFVMLQRYQLLEGIAVSPAEKELLANVENQKSSGSSSICRESLGPSEL